MKWRQNIEDENNNNNENDNEIMVKDNSDEIMKIIWMKW